MAGESIDRPPRGPPRAAGATIARHVRGRTALANGDARPPPTSSSTGRRGPQLAGTTETAAHAATRSSASAVWATSSTCDEVEQVYLPLSRLLSLYVGGRRRLHREQEEFLHRVTPPRTPFVIGLAGSVAVGKSTTARVLQQMLAHWPEHPNVALVTTDGFLLPQRRARAPRHPAPQGLPGVLRPQGAAASSSSTSSPAATRSRRRPTPTSSTTSSPTRRSWSSGPTSSSSRASTCSSPPRVRDDGRTGLAVSDFFDFSVYVDAALTDIKRWYVDRFLRLRETAFRDPASYFAKYAALTHDEAVDRGHPHLGLDQRAQPRRRTSPRPAPAPPSCCARTPTTRCATSRLRKL